MNIEHHPFGDSSRKLVTTVTEDFAAHLQVSDTLMVTQYVAVCDLSFEEQAGRPSLSSGYCNMGSMVSTSSLLTTFDAGSAALPDCHTIGDPIGSTLCHVEILEPMTDTPAMCDEWNLVTSLHTLRLAYI